MSEPLYPDSSTELRVERAVYGGSGLARSSTGEAVCIPFTLPGELVEVDRSQQTIEGQQAPALAAETTLLRILEASPQRTLPPCPHFGPCGGCQYQMATYPEQLRMKEAILTETLQRAGVTALPAITVHSAEPWQYRNRIRLRIERVDGQIRFGYNVRGTQRFLPITTCPIAAPVLWAAAAALADAAATSEAAGDAALLAWLDAASEAELFCNADQTHVQLTLLCPGTTPSPTSFARAMEALRLQPRAGSTEPQGAAAKKSVGAVTSAAALRIDSRTGRAIRTLVEIGPTGLSYLVPLAGAHIEPPKNASYWISRGGFFQVNRFLLPTLVELVCTREGRPRAGQLAWDLFAGVGLFSRILARSFAQVTAVEAHPGAAADLRAALARSSPASAALQSTTLDFLRSAVLQRERPELLVLDPPRAGAGVEACTLIARLAPRDIVYVSCDPTTLARDLLTLQPHYQIVELHLVDLFPQTFHLETVVVLERR